MSNGQDASLTIRLHDTELETFKKAARKAGISLAAFVRDACHFASQRDYGKRRKRK